MEYRKTVLMDLSEGQQQTRRHREQTTDTGGVEEREGEINVEQHSSIYTLPYVKQPMEMCCMNQGTQTEAL